MSGTMEVERVTLDFEDAEIEGIKRIFPDVTIIGCKFHFNQALIRKAKKKGLMGIGNERETRGNIFKINSILEKGESLDEYLLKMEEEYTLNVKNSKQNTGILINYMSKKN